MPGFQGERAGQEASQLPLGSLCDAHTCPQARHGETLVRAYALQQNNLIWSGYWG